MSNKIFVDKFVNEIDDLVKENARADNISRIATKGDIMENVTSDFLARYFPNRCGFGKGLIQDSYGNQSKEVDIIIYDRDSIPPICHGITKGEERKSEGFFPIESLWYAIEVKKTLNNTRLKEAVDNMLSVRTLTSHTGIAPRMLFAFNSDLNGGGIKKEFERYKKIDSNWNSDPAITVICIIGKGYIFVNIKNRKKDNKNVLVWEYVEAQDNYFEVACCVGGMINSITGQSFGSYLFDESSIQTLEEIEM